MEVKKLGILFLMIGVICVIYGCLIYAVVSGTKFFAIWYLIAAFFFWISFMTWGSHWKGVPVVLRVVLAVVLSCAVLVLVVGNICIMTEFHDKGKSRLDTIIVLGAQVRTSGPSRVLRSRLDTASDYLKENPETICIVSGGQGPNEPCTEAEAMKKYLVGKGIPEGRILEENKSESTLENLEYSSKLLDRDRDSIGIVTNDFHVFRSMRLAKKDGYRNVCGIAAPSNPLYLPNNMLRECLGIVKEVVCGNF
ncbi:MAG: YdcF family protein [Bilifractor sp.]